MKVISMQNNSSCQSSNSTIQFIIRHCLIGLLSVACLMSQSSFAAIEVAEDLPPWRLSIVGPSTGDAVISGDSSTLNLSISNVCVSENIVEEDFSAELGENLSAVGFQLFGESAVSLQSSRATVAAVGTQVLFAPTVLTDSENISLSAKLMAVADGATSNSLTLFMGDENRAGYGVQYLAGGGQGSWVLVGYSDGINPTILAQVGASGTRPSIPRRVVLNRVGDDLSVTINGNDIGLSYSVTGGIGEMPRYGFRSEAVPAGTSNYIDDLALAFDSTADCPALADAGDWDDAFSLHFIHQELMKEGRLIARLASYSNSTAGVAGIALRNGNKATDKAVALVLDSGAASIDLYVRDSEGAANTHTVTGFTGTIPQWFKLERSGDNISAYTSIDGSAWTQIDSVTVSLDEIVSAGIVVAVTGIDDQSLAYDNIDIVNELSGQITADLTLAAKQVYNVVDNLEVMSGVTLTINEGATLLFDDRRKLTVNGNVIVNGSDEFPVKFSSAQSEPSSSDWMGFLVQSGGSVFIDHAIIEYVDFGIKVNSGGAADVNNSVIQFIGRDGIFFNSGRGSVTNSAVLAAARGAIRCLNNSDIVLDNNTLTDSIYGISVEGDSDIQIESNTLSGNDYGIYTNKDVDATMQRNIIIDNDIGLYIKSSEGGRPESQVTLNTIANNISYGVYVNGNDNATYDPLPVITDNSLHSNGIANYFATNFANGPLVTLNATGNWWGSVDSRVIADGIIDYSDTENSTDPYVNYSGFIDSENGAPVALPNPVLGTLTENTVFSADTTYTLIGSVVIQNGVTLTVEAGAQINFNGDYPLQVNGILAIQGTELAPVILSSDASVPIAGDWQGVVVNNGGVAVINHAIIEYAEYGVYVNSGARADIDYSTIQFINKSAVYFDFGVGSVTNSNITTVVDAGIWAKGSADIVVSDNNFTQGHYGIFLDGNADISLTDNTASENYYGAYISGDSDATIDGNSFSLNTVGLYIRGLSDGVAEPQITNNTITENSEYGIYVIGSNDSSYDPLPVAIGNAIHTNVLANYFVSDFENGPAVLLNATGNWWGTIDPELIAVGIIDYSDSGISTVPNVDTNGFLDGENGNPVVIQNIEGTLTENTAFTPGVNYFVIGDLLVDVGVTLTIEAGATVEFSGDYALAVNGTIEVLGTETLPVILRSSASEPAAGDWQGVVVNSGGITVLNYALIEYAEYGVYVNPGARADIDNSTIQFINKSAVYFDLGIGSVTNSNITTVVDAGIWAKDSDDIVISDNALSESQYGVYLDGDADISVTGNSVSANDYGVYLSGDADATIDGNSLSLNTVGIYIRSLADGVPEPHVSNNTIFENSEYGVYVIGSNNANYDPLPVVVGNSIHSNVLANYFAGDFGNGPEVSLDATSNWWGSIDPLLIAAGIIDYADSGSNIVPYVEYSGYLDGENGNPVVVAEDVVGTISGDTVFTTGVDYFVVGDVIVDAGVTLTIEAGARLEFSGDFVIDVNGNIDIQGTADSPVVFISEDNVPTEGDWQGIVVHSGGSAIINYATIEYAENGIEIEAGGAAVITNNTIRFANIAAIRVDGSSNIIISGNTLTDSNYGVLLDDGAHGIDIIDNAILNNYQGVRLGLDSDSMIQGNTFSGNSYAAIYNHGDADSVIVGNSISNNTSGLYIWRDSSSVGAPELQITNNTITNNTTYGLYIVGDNEVEHDPVLVVTGNSIYGNGTANYFVTAYENGPNVTLNATGNWWGTTDLRDIADGIVDYSDSGSGSVPFVDYSGFLDGENGNPIVIDNLIVGVIPEDVVFSADTVNIVTGRVIVPTGVTLTIEAGALLEFNGEYIIEVSGDLNIQGSESSPVILSSEASTQEAEAWEGVVVRSGGSANINYATIEYTENGIDIETGGSAVIANNTIRYASNAAIRVVGSSNMTISGNTLTDSEYGIFLNDDASGIAIIDNTILDNYVGTHLDSGSDSIIQDNTFSGNSYAAIHAYGNAAVIIDGNSISNNNRGLNFYRNTSSVGAPEPQITNNTITNNSVYGLYFFGDNDSGNDPIPVISGNSIYDNDAANLYVYAFENGSEVTVNATGNWWGTTDIKLISDGIYDYSDTGNNLYPFADYSGFLDGENGNPVVVDDLLVGVISTDTALSADTVYTVNGRLVVPTGITLTIEEGAQLEFNDDYAIEVSGELNIQGTDSSPVILTSDTSEPEAGDWEGIVIRSGGAAIINYATVEYAERGIEVEGSAEITNSAILANDYGVYLDSGSDSTLKGNTFDGNSYGVYGYGDADALIDGNSISNNTSGLYFLALASGVDPAVLSIVNNTITDNSNYGLYFAGINNSDDDPQPVVNGNSIHGNSVANFYALNFENGPAVTLDATGNWWGTTDLQAISDGIEDYSDSPGSTRPYVDYLGFLDGENGDPVIIDNLIVGMFTEDSVISAGTDYTLIGAVIVPSGVTLTVEAGARLLSGGFTFEVSGHLDILGTDISPVLMSSNASEPQEGDWKGIVIHSGGSAIVNHATIEFVENGIDIEAGGSAVITNNTIRYASNAAIRVDDSSNIAITSNTLTDSRYGIILQDDSNNIEIIENTILDNVYGVYLDQSSDSMLQDNTFIGNDYAIYGYGDADAVISGNSISNNTSGLYFVALTSGADPAVLSIINNTITYNSNYGLYFYGINNSDDDPQPVVNGNSIHGNSVANFYAANFEDGPTVTLDATGNWWGTTDLQAIGEGIQDYSDSPASTRPYVDYLDFLDDENGNPVVLTENVVVGAITENTVFSADNHYTLIGGVIVQSGVTLTIEEGSELFTRGFTFEVSGNLEIQGTELNPVILSSDEIEPAAGDWQGIVVHSGGSAIINFATIEYVENGVNVEEGGNTTITNSTIRFANNAAIRVDNSSNISISGNALTANKYGVFLNDDANNIVISNNSILDNVYGVYLDQQSDSTLQDNIFTGNDYAIYGYGDADAIIDGNSISSNTSGLYFVALTSGADPAVLSITNNTITDNSNYGLYFDGAKNSDDDPIPVVTGNSIFANSTANFFVSDFEGGPTVTLNATGNWWGTTEPREIAVGITDYSDSTDSLDPFVDYLGFLDGPDGEPAVVDEDILVGAITGDTVLGAGITYLLIGNVVVESGVTLTIENGSHLVFSDQYTLVVSGNLEIQGTELSPVLLTSEESFPDSGDLKGIVINSGGSAIINYAIIDYAENGVAVEEGGNATITNNTIRFASNAAIRVDDSSNMTISGNTLTDSRYGILLNDDSNDIVVSNNSILDNVYGVYLDQQSDSTLQDNIFIGNDYAIYGYGDADAIIDGNSISNNTSGIYFILLTIGDDPVVLSITNNTITDNSNYGLYFVGINNSDYDPKPVVTGNSIFANSTANFFTRGFEGGPAVTLNATGNWWGTTDPVEIAAGISDYSDSGSSTVPYVDYSGYLDRENGVAAYDGYLRFDIDSNTTLNAGTYVVLDSISVTTSGTLNLASGTILEFSSYGLTVTGSLVAAGLDTQSVVFTSTQGTPRAGDWEGLSIESGGSVSLDNVQILYAKTALAANEPTLFSVSNSVISDFTVRGVELRNSPAGLINANLIQNSDNTGTGIYIDTASPDVTDNIIRGTEFGIYIAGASSPLLIGNSIVTNDYGIYLNGANDDSSNPTPIITNNDIFNNVNGSLVINNYGINSTLVIDASENWWGTSEPAIGDDIIVTDSPASAVDYAGAASAEHRVSLLSASIDRFHFSPNNDGILDDVTLTASLSASTSWRLNIVSEADNVVRTYTGIGATIDVNWDGRSDTSEPQSDGRYFFNLYLEIEGDDSFPVSLLEVSLDQTFPIAELTSLTDGEVLSIIDPNLLIQGSASDAQLANYSVEYQLASDADNWITLNSSSVPVSDNVLAEWLLNASDGSVEAPPSGDYLIRLTASDVAGNVSTVIRLVTINVVSISNVGQNLTTLYSSVGEVLEVGFDLSSGAVVTMAIKGEQTNLLVRSITETFLSGGTYTLSWDGKDDLGAYAQDEAYVYELAAISGDVQSVYAPVDDDQTDSNLIGTMDYVMNAAQNDFMKIGVEPTENIRISLAIAPEGEQEIELFDNVPLEAGYHTLMWDGRTEEGALVSGAFSASILPHIVLPTNVVIVKGVAPTITGTLGAPNIEVKSDPYLMYHSYDQLTKIAYHVDQDSYVTFKLLPPEVGDPSHVDAITLVDNEFHVAKNGTGEAQVHEVEWKGYDSSDSNRILVSEEGVFSFWIEATSTITGASTAYYGSVQLYK